MCAAFKYSNSTLSPLKAKSFCSFCTLFCGGEGSLELLLWCLYNIQQEADIYITVPALGLTVLRCTQLCCLNAEWSLSFALLYFCRFSPVSELAPVGMPVGMILAAAVNTTVFYSIVSGNEGGEFLLWREFTKPVYKYDSLTRNNKL